MFNCEQGLGCLGLVTAAGCQHRIQSAEPAVASYGLLANPEGSRVLKAVVGNYYLRPVGTETEEQLAQRCAALYIQDFGSRGIPQEPSADPCFHAVMATVTPRSTRKEGPGSSYLTVEDTERCGPQTVALNASLMQDSELAALAAKLGPNAEQQQAMLQSFLNRKKTGQPICVPQHLYQSLPWFWIITAALAFGALFLYFRHRNGNKKSTATTGDQQ